MASLCDRPAEHLHNGAPCSSYEEEPSKIGDVHGENQGVVFDHREEETLDLDEDRILTPVWDAGVLVVRAQHMRGLHQKRYLMGMSRKSDLELQLQCMHSAAWCSFGLRKVLAKIPEEDAVI